MLYLAIVSYFSFLNNHLFLSALGFLIILIIYNYIIYGINILKSFNFFMYYLYIFVSIAVIIPFLLQFVLPHNKIMQYVLNIILFIFLHEVYPIIF
jgi:hypothetical protein